MGSRNGNHDWVKLEILIYKRICPILRKIFEERWRCSEGTKWQNSEQYGQSFVNGIGSLVYRNAGRLRQLKLQEGDINNWDFTTLIKALTDSRFENLQKSKLSEENERLNQLMDACQVAENCEPKSMRNSDFVKCWNKMEALMISFGESEESIEKLRHSPDVSSVDSGRDSACYESVQEAEHLRDCARKLMKSKEFSNALKFANQAASLAGLPDDELSSIHVCRSEIFYKMAQNCQNSEDKKEKLYLSLSNAKTAQSLQPNWALPYFRLGTAYMDLGKPKKASKYFDNALDLEPNVKEIQRAHNRCRHQVRKISEDDDVFIDDLMPVASNHAIPGRTSYSPEVQMLIDAIYSPNDLTFTWVLRGHQYRDGHNVEQDLRQAAMFYRRAAKNKNPEAMYNLALMKLEGKGVRQDMDGALALLKEASNVSYNGHQAYNGNSITNIGVPESKFVLGMIHEEGIVGLQKSYFQASIWYKEAVRNAYGPAAHNLACLHLLGRGVVKDPKRSVQLWKQAAAKKVPEAMHALAIHYLKEWCSFEAIKHMNLALITPPAINISTSDKNVMIFSTKDLEVLEDIAGKIEFWKKKYHIRFLANWEIENGLYHNKDQTFKDRLIRYLKMNTSTRSDIVQIEDKMKRMRPIPIRIPFPLAKAVSKSRSDAYFQRGFSFSGSVSRTPSRNSERSPSPLRSYGRLRRSLTSSPASSSPSPSP